MNAVFERDFVRLSTSKRFLWMRAGLALAVACLIGFNLLRAYASGDKGGIAILVLSISIYAGTTLLMLAAPGAFATVLVHARAQNTLAVLLSTPLTPFQLAWGAYAARAASLSVFVLATLPPIALGLAFGGMQVEQIGSASAAVLAATLLVSAPSFVVSAFAKRTGVAVVSSYLSAATLLVALWAVGEQVTKTGVAQESVTAFSPVHAIELALSPSARAGAVLAGCLLLLCLSLLVSVGAILAATWRLQQEARGDLEAKSQRRDGRPPRPLRYENPILDRELSLGASRSGTTNRTLLALLVVAEIGYACAAWWSGDARYLPLFTGFLVFELALLVLAAAAAGATSLAAEKETGALDLIRVTPLTPAQIVRGKLVGLLRNQLPCLIVPLVHLTWGVVAGILNVAALPLVAVSGLIVVSTWAIFGMSQSLDQRDAHRAVVRTMAALAIVGVIIAAQAGWVLWHTLSDCDDYIRLTGAFGANPIAAILGGAAALRTGGSNAEMKSMPAPPVQQVVGALVGSVLWLFLHVATALLVYRRLVMLYRTRFEG